MSGGGGVGVTVAQTLAGTFAGLIVLAVVGAMFMTAEYRRRLILVTLTAAPRRGRVLAAKAVVVAAVTFTAGLGGAAIAVVLGQRVLRGNGAYVYPASALTQVRVIAGTAAVLAVTAVIALAIGTILRRGTGAVAVVVTVIVLPYLFTVAAPILPSGAAGWLLRVTPAAAFAVQQTCHPVPAGQQHLHCRLRLLSAAAVGGLRRAVRVGRARPRAGRLPAAPEGRLSCVARQGTQWADLRGARYAMHAEWTKTRTAAARSGCCSPSSPRPSRSALRWPRRRGAQAAGCGQDPAKVSLSGIDLGQAVVATLAVLAISGEYGTGMIRVTLTAMPRRVTVLAAKAAVLTGLVLAAGTVAVLGSVLAGRLIMPAMVSPRRTVTRCCLWRTGRTCVPPPGRSCI